MKTRHTILFVCTGNICRSAMAEGLLKDRLAREGKEQIIQVRSAGIWGLDGQMASAHAILAMDQRGIDIRGHRARTLTQKEVDQADLILAMAQAHADAIRKYFKRWEGKLFLLSEMVGKKFDIEDPYGAPLSAYISCVTRIAEIIEHGYERIMAILKAREQSI